MKTNRELTDDFKKEIIEVCKRHKLSISHEDEQGAFVITRLDTSCIDWFMNARLEKDLLKAEEIKSEKYE